MFFKTGALKKFRNIQRKTPMLESLFNKAAGLKSCNFVKKKALAHMFSCEYCKIFKNIFLWNTSGGCFCLWFNRDMRLFETVVFIIIMFFKIFLPWSLSNLGWINALNVSYKKPWNKNNVHLTSNTKNYQ